LFRRAFLIASFLLVSVGLKAEITSIIQFPAGQNFDVQFSSGSVFSSSHTFQFIPSSGTLQVPKIQFTDGTVQISSATSSPPSGSNFDVQFSSGGVFASSNTFQFIHSSGTLRTPKVQYGDGSVQTTAYSSSTPSGILNATQTWTGGNTFLPSTTIQNLLVGSMTASASTIYVTGNIQTNRDLAYDILLSTNNGIYFNSGNTISMFGRTTSAVPAVVIDGPSGSALAGTGNLIFLSNRLGTPSQFTVGATQINVYPEGNQRMMISSTATLILTDQVTQPYQPSFLVTDGTGATDITGDATVYQLLWPTEVYDQNSDFSASTFTAPVSGRYLLSATIIAGGLLTTHINRELSLITSNRTYYVDDDASAAATANSFYSFTINVVADMDAFDTAIVSFLAQGGTKTVDIFNDVRFNYFSGSLIN